MTALSIRPTSPQSVPRRSRAKPISRGSRLEKLLTHPDGFGLVDATPTQRAICRCLDGVDLGELRGDPEVQWAFTGKSGAEALAILDELPVGVIPAETILCAAIRGAKTLISAALAFTACLTVDLSGTRTNETVRYSIAATEMEKARVAIEHLKGTIPEARILRPYFLRSTNQGVVVRHPSGRPIEIRVIVAGRGGRGVISRWSAGLTVDEAARMQGEGGMANLPDILHAVHGRLLPGAQVFMPGSPWAPKGPVFDAVQDEWGKPSKARVVIRATGPMLNPSWWTPERIAETRAKKDGELVVQTDVLANFGSLPTAFFTPDDVSRATRPVQARDADGLLVPLPFEPQRVFAAAIDPATRGNAWTLVVASWIEGATDNESLAQIALAHEWVGTRSEPLQATEVFAEMWPMLAPYGITEVWSDQHNFDPNAEHARSIKIELPGGRVEQHRIDLLKDDATDAEKKQRYLDLREMVIGDAPEGLGQKKRLSLPPDPVFRADMLGIVKELTRTGLNFPLPVSVGGRHCDYIPAATLALARAKEGAGGFVRAMQQGRAKGFFAG
jgi:hypothetical protein